MTSRPGLEGARKDRAVVLCMAALLTVLAGCSRGFGGGADSKADDDAEAPSLDKQPLLGSSHGGHAWFDYCEGKEDAALLPPDPRSLVQPGANAGKAVHFNTWWKDCHIDPELVGERAHPKTCGELRESYARGEKLMRGNGAVGAGSFFAGDTGDGGGTGITAAAYNNLWQMWGLTSRPDNFDQLVSERYGMPIGPERNPYPLPGEDPQLTDGGSGQLSAFMTQLRGPNGEWTGSLGFTCHACHSGAAGLPEEGAGLGFQYGSGTGLHDIGLMAREVGLRGAPQSLVGLAFSLFGTSRGTNNAQFGNIVALPDAQSSPDEVIGWLTSGSTASMDTPAWWNNGHRPVKFIDGVTASDAVRIDLAFYGPLLAQDGGAWVKAHDQDADYWLLASKAPAYPLPIDQKLAEQGAILFHMLNLWDRPGNESMPRPGGNGSCAACHGAYSPRFANDPAFLDDPGMAGIASYIVPMSIIKTDPERLEAFSEEVQQSNGGGFEGYPETVGTVQDCGAQNRPEVRGDREQGYLAPPLHGVWATAPYLHNGAIPDVWTLLKPEERPPLWRRASTPARADQEGKVVMGFDVSIARAYDADKLGWKYERLECGAGILPFVDCDPTNAQADPLVQQLLAEIYGNLLLSWNVGNAVIFTQWLPAQVENRKIYNTHLFSQGNEGHDFTAVLSDLERRALIEYLKTL